jgi:hypothetical protein
LEGVAEKPRAASIQWTKQWERWKAPAGACSSKHLVAHLAVLTGWLWEVICQAKAQEQAWLQERQFFAEPV